MPKYFIFKEIPTPVERHWLVEAETKEEAAEIVENLLQDGGDADPADLEAVLIEPGWHDVQTMGEEDVADFIEEAGDFKDLDHAAEETGVEGEPAEDVLVEDAAARGREGGADVRRTADDGDDE